jgi:glycosyltransferase involved in cell wall biosynthesis
VKPSTGAPEGIDVSILVTTYERPAHLALALESLAAQRAPGCGLEVIVSDDGSTDHTADVVAAFAARTPFPVRFTSQPHDGFRLARVRNAAARLARGRYLLFLDGDCLVPPHHVAAHLDRRRPGTALLGFCARLTPEASATVAEAGPTAIDLTTVVPRAERRALGRRWLRARWHAAVRHPSKPRLAGGDFGLWRADFERVNGFDERFVGWGQEDDDLGLRLRAAGIRLESILDRTASLHLWHPPDPTAGRRWRDGANVAYFSRRGRLACCRTGLEHRGASQVSWGLPADCAAVPLGRAVAALLAAAPLAPRGAGCEIDVVVRPGSGRFQRPAECRLALLATQAGLPAPHLEPAVARQADRIERIDPHDANGLARILDEAG